MRRSHWLVWSSLFALAGCASLLSLDDLKVEKVDGAAGTGGGLAGAAGAAGVSGGGAGTGGGGSSGTGGGGSGGAGAGGGGSAGASGAGAGGTGGGGAAGSAGQALAVPPPRPVGNPVPAGGKRLVFAVRNFWLGLSDPVTHAADPDAWRKYGFDFDGKCTTLDESKADTSGVCHRVKGSPPQAHVDGDGCRDNNFGGIIVSAVALAQQDLESKLNNGLAKGGATMLLIIDDVDPGTADDPYAPGRLYVATDSTTVKWDGNDVREIDANTVFSGDLAKAKSEFKRGYIKNNTWVSGEHNDTPSSLIFPVSGEPVVLDATTLIVTLEFDAAREKVVHSDLGAVLNIEKFIAAVTPSLAKTAGCGSFSLYVDIISKTPDLFDARTSFSDPTMPCNALSLGGMLDWLPVKEPTKVISVPPLPDLCDGGT